MNPLISIIIPVYNNEHYIKSCIYSILNQDFTNIEIILINDGSIDNSLAVCKELEKKYKSIKVYSKENQGIVLARKSGLQQALGDWIMFVDADDELLPGSIKLLYEIALEGYDIVKGENLRVLNGNTTKEVRINQELTLNSSSYLESIVKGQIPPYLWGGIYRKKVFSIENFEKYKNISLHEDWITNIAIAQEVKSYKYINKPVYSYLINPLSIMQGKVKSNIYVQTIISHLKQLTNNKNIDNVVELRIAQLYLDSFFTPETNFEDSFYQYIKKNIVHNSYLWKELTCLYNKRRLLFFKYKYIYKCYCNMYCLLYKYIKLRGKSRKII